MNNTISESLKNKLQAIEYEQMAHSAMNEKINCLNTIVRARIDALVSGDNSKNVMNDLMKEKAAIDKIILETVAMFPAAQQEDFLSKL